MLRQFGREFGIRDARFDADEIGADFQNAAEMHAEIDDQTGAERLARKARSRAACGDGDAVFVGVFHDRAKVGFVGGNHDAERQDLKRAGIGGIERAREIVAAESPANERPQIVDQLNGKSFRRHATSYLSA